MSKAVIGAAETGLAFAATAWVGGIGGLAVLAAQGGMLGLYTSATLSLFATGLATEAGAIAAAIGGQNGIGVTTRQAAGQRQIVYGTCRPRGTSVYESTTGVGGSGGNYVYNWIIVLAAHEIDGIQNLFLDGRQVYWKQSTSGYRANMGQGSVSNPPTTTVTLSAGAVTAIGATGGSGFANVKPVDGYRVIIRGNGTGATAYATNSGSVGSPVWTVHVTNGGTGYTSATAEIQGAFTFGGIGAADQQDPSLPGYGLGYGIGPGGPHYNFSGKVYCEARWGDQPAGDLMTSLQSNDSAWTPPGGQNLSGQGCAYIYLNVGYDTDLFPQRPEVKVTINGKNHIYDPRTAKIGFSTNWALQVADVIADTAFGLGDGPISSWPTDALDQLIAAANVCDQAVSTSQGNEANYAQHLVYDTSTSPGEALSQMMPAAGGRFSRIGGGWYIWPAYWQGPSLSFDESALIDTPSWTPTRSFRELVNRVNGTFIAPNYPYNVAGNLYDKNGWYYGTTANNWPLEWQPTNFPQYAQDTLHGYASDALLAADGGIQLPLELSLRGVISIVQAQRLAKIALLRNRQQGMGSFPMQLAAMQIQPLDVVEFTFPFMGWSGKYLEAGQFHFVFDQVKGDGDDHDETPAITVMVPFQETAAAVYEWSESEELTPYDVPALPGAVSGPQSPSGLTLTAGSATSLVQADLTAAPRLLVSWASPADIYITQNGQIQLQWADYAGLFEGGAWIDLAGVSGAATYCYFDVPSPVTNINLRIRAVWPNGAPGAWVSVTNVSVTRGTVTLPTATTLVQGIVQVDGASLKVVSGLLSLNASFGSGAPSGTPTELQLYFNTATSPYTGYVGHSGAWHQIS